MYNNIEGRLDLCILDLWSLWSHYLLFFINIRT
jgi:hypothetical protein